MILLIGLLEWDGGTTVGTTSNVISYLVTTTIGGTTFMRNNPQYRRVDYP